jgi:hypothetical protein
VKAILYSEFGSPDVLRPSIRSWHFVRGELGRADRQDSLALRPPRSNEIADENRGGIKYLFLRLRV